MAIVVQLVGLGFALFIIYLSYVYYKKRVFSSGDLVLWFLLFFGFSLVVLFHSQVEKFVVGREFARVFDFVVFIGFLVMFSFLIYMHGLVKKNDKKVERLVREIAIYGKKGRSKDSKEKKD